MARIRALLRSVPAPGVRPAAAAALSLALAFPAQAQLLREDFWVPNAGVEDLAVVDDAVYLGGSFTQVGPASGAFVGLDATTGSALQPFPQVVGYIRAAVGDGAGGWYIGGFFSSVRGQPRTNIAHIDAAGNVTAWDPGVNGNVFALARDAATGVVYAGGSFSMVGGQSRFALAAIDANGAVTAFDAGFAPVSAVNALTHYGATLYAVGSFTRPCIRRSDAGAELPPEAVPQPADEYRAPPNHQGHDLGSRGAETEDLVA